MYKLGDVVCFNEYKFQGRIKDNKKFRPCIVLFSYHKDNEDKICVVPLTSKVETFNKHPNKYVLIPEIVYNYNILSFVKLDSVTLNNSEDAINTGIKVDEATCKKIIDKIEKINIKTVYQKREYMFIKKVLMYIKLFDKIDGYNNAIRSKKLKNENRRKAKKQIKV